MQIALCDDEAAFLTATKSMIMEYAGLRHYDITCTLFTRGEELLGQEKFDLYFLDYLMPEQNGVSLGMALKNKFNGAFTVVYLTSYERAAMEVINHNIYAEGFLTKPVEPQKLYALLDRLYNMSLFNRIILKKEHSTRVLYPQEIMFAEAYRRKTVFYFADGEEEFPYSISDVEETILPKKLFCRVHRSYIVNLMHVKGYDGKLITMSNGKTVPLSDAKGFNRLYISFQTEF